MGAGGWVAEGEGKESPPTMAGVEEAAVGRGRISWVSPLARALIKARAGDSVRFQSPLGVRELDIVDVAYQSIV